MLVLVWPERAPQKGEQLAADWVRVHVTPWLERSFVTVAVKERVEEVATEAAEGETETDIEAAELSVIVADALFSVFETLVALS